MAIRQVPPMTYHPITGALLALGISAQNYREITRLKEGRWYFNPWTGGARKESDTWADPYGYDIPAPGDSY